MYIHIKVKTRVGPRSYRIHGEACAQIPTVFTINSCSFCMNISPKGLPLKYVLCELHPATIPMERVFPTNFRHEAL